MGGGASWARRRAVASSLIGQVAGISRHQQEQYMNDPFKMAENAFTKMIPPKSNMDASVNYMTARVLSMDSRGFTAASLMNSVCINAPKWATYGLGYYVCPAGSPRRNKYIKKPKPTYTEKEMRIIECVQETLRCTPQHAMNTYDLLKAAGFDFTAYYGQKIAK